MGYSGAHLRGPRRRRLPVAGRHEPGPLTGCSKGVCVGRAGREEWVVPGSALVAAVRAAAPDAAARVARRLPRREALLHLLLLLLCVRACGDVRGAGGARVAARLGGQALAWPRHDARWRGQRAGVPHGCAFGARGCAPLGVNAGVQARPAPRDIAAALELRYQAVVGLARSQPPSQGGRRPLLRLRLLVLLRLLRPVIQAKVWCVGPPRDGRQQRGGLLLLRHAHLRLQPISRLRGCTLTLLLLVVLLHLRLHCHL